jgi:O-antigen ligase
VLLLKNRRHIFYAPYVWLGMFLIPLSFIVSNFRGLTTSFFIGIIFYLFILFRYRIISGKVVNKIIASTVAAVIIGIALATSVFQYNLIDRFLFREQNRDVVFSLGRLFLYQQAISAFLASPIVGIGTGNYRYTIERPVRIYYFNIVVGEKGVDETERESVSSHSDALTILAETGVAGVVVYLCINYIVITKLIVLLKEAKKTKKRENVVLTLSFLTSLAMFHLTGLFENTAPNNIIFVFFIYAASTTWFSPDHESSIVKT